MNQPFKHTQGIANTLEDVYQAELKWNNME